MSTPQPGMPGYEKPPPNQPPAEQYGASPQPEYAEPSSPTQDGQQQSAASRKKRHYAGQAYEFGGGANAALGGQQQGGGQYPGPPGAGYGNYSQQPQQPGYQQPPLGGDPAAPVPGGTPGYPQSPPGVGGYQPPDAGYPGPGAPPQPGVGGITQGMGNLAMGGPAQPPSQQMQRPLQLNQLYPTDLLNQPMSPAELNLPPPPIVLPPNVS